ncbi:MAG: hypothetical protein EOO27_47495, partial [Comamonadaceae bacterium]
MLAFDARQQPKHLLASGMVFKRAGLRSWLKGNDRVALAHQYFVACASDHDFLTDGPRRRVKCRVRHACGKHVGLQQRGFTQMHGRSPAKAPSTMRLVHWPRVNRKPRTLRRQAHATVKPLGLLVACHLQPQFRALRDVDDQFSL